ncbi:hypothetical protein H4R19_003913, partial [Coemansia spiralis]
MVELVPGDLKVADLRKELAARDLPTNGLKKDLVKRLEEALASASVVPEQATDADEIELLPADEQSEVDAEQDASVDGDAASRTGAEGADDSNKRRAEGPPEQMDVDEGGTAPNGGDHESQDVDLAAGMQMDEAGGEGEARDSLFVKNLERPLTVYRMKEHMAQYGAVNDIWLNSIKTRAYVNFSTAQEAAAAFGGVNKTKFPPEHGQVLECGLITKARMAALVATENSMADAVHNLDLVEVPDDADSCGIDLLNTKSRRASSKRQKTERPVRAGDADTQTMALVVGAATAAATEARDAGRAGRATARQTEPAAGARIEEDGLTRWTKAQPPIMYR